MGLDKVPAWWRGKRATHDASCYSTKAQALHAFADANVDVIEAAGGIDQPQGHLDAVNERYGLRGARKARTLGEAFWHALPPGRPFCIDRIDLSTLNEAMADARHGELRLPDHVVEERAMRETYEQYDRERDGESVGRAAILDGVDDGPRLWPWVLGGVAGIFLFFRMRKKPPTLATGSVSTAALAKLVTPFADQHKIPVSVVVTWIMLESSGNPNAYNPEQGALAKWSEQIAGNQKWAANPEWEKVGIVRRMLAAGTTAKEIAAASAASIPYKDRLWTFGSSGLMQVSRIAAEGAGFPASESNQKLFDPTTNVKIGTQVIANLRKSIYPGKTELSTFQWSIVRAGYVLGAAGVKTRLAQSTTDSLGPVREKQTRFYDALAKVTGVAIKEPLAEAVSA